jgi:hypothetical protein
MDEEFDNFQGVAAKSSNEDCVSRGMINTIESSNQETYGGYGSSTKAGL